MKTILIIGMTGEGKSDFVKHFIQGRNCLVFDVQNEYGERTKYPDQIPLNLPTNTMLPRSRYIGGNFKEFTKLVRTKRNTICVFEEATMFLQGKLGNDTVQLMINKMHTGNVYLFLFHSISSVPPRIMQLVDYVVLYRTNDEDYQVQKKYPRLYHYYIKLIGQPRGINFKIKII